MKRLLITPAITEYIEDCFDEEPLSEEVHKDGSITFEYKDCEYYLDDADKSESGVSDNYCFIKFNTTWRGTKANMQRGGGKLTLKLMVGDKAPIHFENN